MALTFAPRGTWSPRRLSGMSQAGQAPYLLFVVSAIIISRAWTQNQNADCGGEFGGDSGNLYSPAYPDRYPAISSCTYLITRNSSGDTRLQFVVFQMYSTSCYTNKLEIYQGYNISKDTLVGEFCRQLLLPASGAIVVLGEVVTVVFTAGGLIGAQGFHLRYSSANESCESLGGLCVSEWCLQTTDYFCANGDQCCTQHSPLRPVCGGLYLVDSGVLFSPDYPGEYPMNQHCLYVFVRADSVVAGRLSVLRIEESNGGCGFDYVRFFDGPGTGSPSLTERLCSQGMHTVLSSGPYLSMVFETDLTIAYQGFVFFWGEPECHHHAGICTSGSCQNWKLDVVCLEGGSCCLDSCSLTHNRICPNGQCIERTRDCDSDLLEPLPGGIRCPSDGHICPDGSCIGNQFVCECSNYDEHRQTFCWDGTCVSSWYECSCDDSHPRRCEDFTGCYSASQACDGSRECADGTDEYCTDCDESHPLHCDDSIGCYSDSQACDGSHECADGSDEFMCTEIDSDLVVILAPIGVIGGLVVLACCCYCCCPRVESFLEGGQSRNQSADAPPTYTTTQPTLTALNSVENGTSFPLPEYEAPPTYGEYENYASTFDDSPNAPASIYSRPSGDRTQPEVPPPAYETVAHINNPEGDAAAAQLPNMSMCQSTPSTSAGQCELETTYV